MKALHREVNDLKEAVGDRFQDQFRSIVRTLRHLVG
jgi:hypothetical protein